MKEAIITDLNGRYIEPTLVADSVTGVFDRTEPVLQMEDEAPRAAAPDEPETVLVGYTVAIALPDGLYDPTFDIEGYRKAVKVYEVAFDAYLEARAAYDPEGEEPKPKSPQQVDGSTYWRNGLTDEEIEALKPKPQPSKEDRLKARIADLELTLAEMMAQ